MENITVDKHELKVIISENRDAHRAVFLEAQDTYRKRLIVLLDERLADARNGRHINLNFGLPVPEDHTEDYNRVLRMLELSVDDQIVLDETDVAQYVQDDWAWKRAWFANTAIYTAGNALSN